MSENSNNRIENLGIVTAYGLARQAGYTGTKEEFSRGLKASANDAANAAVSASSAASSASAAASSAASCAGSASGASASASSAGASASDAEAFACGKRGGTDVQSDDPAYCNNAKYYAQTAEAYKDHCVNVIEDDYPASPDGEHTLSSRLEDETFAKKNGSYPGLVSGSSESLVGHAAVRRLFSHQTSGGSESIGNGVAKIKSIRGKSFFFRQMLRLAGTSTTTDGVTITKNVSDGSVTVVTAQGGATADVSWTCNSHTAVAGHKYLVKGCPPGGSLSTYYLRDDVGYGSIFTAASSGNSGIVLHVKSGTVISSPIVFYPQLFDLTEIFGAGSEPTVEEFTAIFPEPFYAYGDAAAWIFGAGSAWKTVGFNAFDGTKARVVKSFDGTGQNHGYEINGAYGTVEFARTADGARVTLTPESYVTEKGDTVQRILTPENGYVFISGAGADTCLHLIWSGNRSGANYSFEPYAAYETVLPTETYFPDGMKEVGGAYDEITETQAVKRVGFVALSDLAWTRTASTVYTSDYFRTGAGSSSAEKIKVPSSGKANMMTTFIGTAATSSDVGISVKYTSDDNAARMTLRKASGEGYASLDAFLADIAGHYLIYELESPTVTTFGEPLELGAVVDDMGTEEIPRVGNGPLELQISYGVNAQDVISRLPLDYISKESFDEFCEALGEALSLSVTATYNAATGKYTFTVSLTE